MSLLAHGLRGERARQAAEVLELGREARRELRRIMEGKEEEEPGNLRIALARLARDHGGSFIDFTNGTDPEERAGFELRRIAQEAAHNAVKHGAASQVSIRLFPGLLEVEDNGAGPAAEWGEGLGMKLMERRARRMRGRVTLQTVAPGRTILSCHFAAAEKKSTRPVK